MILDEIIKEKKKEIRKNKAERPLDNFESLLKKSERDFKKAITPKISLIAEVKKSSPSEGTIRNDSDFKKLLRIYQQNEVAAISILTDGKYFGGSLVNLSVAKGLTIKPLLRKDFILDKYQIYESRYYGADAILLIARILAKEEMERFINLAKEYNVDCLVEVHDEKDIKKLPANVEIIGINNRNLDTLKVNLNTTLRLLKKLPKDKIIVAESGYSTHKDIQEIKDKVNAVLIGTSILQAENTKEKIEELLQ